MDGFNVRAPFCIHGNIIPCTGPRRVVRPIPIYVTLYLYILVFSLLDLFISCMYSIELPFSHAHRSKHGAWHVLYMFESRVCLIYLIAELFNGARSSKRITASHLEIITTTDTEKLRFMAQILTPLLDA